MSNDETSPTLRQISHECRMGRPLPPHGEGIREKPVLEGIGQGGCVRDGILKKTAKHWEIE